MGRCGAERNRSGCGKPRTAVDSGYRDASARRTLEGCACPRACRKL